ncbi:unnamed protein product [Urochloa humidicola]
MGNAVMLRALLLALTLAAAAAAAEKRQTYIVHMAKSAMPAEYADHGEWYGASLRSVSTSSASSVAAAKMLYAYDTVLHGFSARLTAKEADDLACLDGVLAVNPETRYELHTTRTPEFLGIAGADGGGEGLFPQSGTAADVVVGVLDTGVWPESRSYDDTGLSEVPTFWKGKCEEGAEFNASACNRKLVGARFFSRGYEAAMGPMDTSRESRSPRDDDGHGTHTSSTAAGAAVPGASLFGFASGTARGMAPRARVAAYKVCWLGGCFSSDILAGMDAAVADGCGVLSLSLGGGAADYSRDSVAIGAFAAMEQGVLVSCSAGNAGPGSSTLSNVAPWITTVGAGTLDRDFPAYVALGNGKNYTGVSLYSGKPLPANTPLPIIYGANASNSTAGNLCMPGTLTPEKVAGKIVVCDRGGERACPEGVRGAGRGGSRHGALQHGGERGGARGRRAPPPGRGGRREGRRCDQVLRGVGHQPDGDDRGRRDAGRCAAVAGGGGVLVEGSQHGDAGDFEAGHHRAGGQHTRGVDGESRAHGARHRHATRRVQHHLRHVHVVPARQRPRRAAPGRPPGVEPRRRAVRAHDHGLRLLLRWFVAAAGRGDGHGGNAVRLRRRACGPGKGGGPGARVRPERTGLRGFPVRAQVQPGHDRRRGEEQGRGHLRREQDVLRGGAKLPVVRRGVRHGERRGRGGVGGDHRDAQAHVDERGWGRDVQGVYVRGRSGGGRGGGRGAEGACVRVGGAEEELHGEVHVQVAAVGDVRIRPARVVRRQAQRGKPNSVHVDLMDTTGLFWRLMKQNGVRVNGPSYGHVHCLDGSKGWSVKLEGLKGCER